MSPEETVSRTAMRAMRRTSLALLLSFPSRALAGETNEAIRLGHDALAAYTAGDRALAESLFERAEKIAHSPVFLLYLARIATKDDRLALALDYYRRLNEESLDDASPNAWKTARSEGNVELARLLETTIEIRFRVDDDVPLPVLLEGESLFRIGARSGTLVLPKDSARLEAHDVHANLLSVRREEMSPHPFLRIYKPKAAIGSPSIAPVVLSPRRPEREAPYRSAVYLSVGFTALFATTGAILGTVALDQANAVKSGCRDGYCDPNDFDRANAAVRNGDLALISLGLAGVSAITGVTLFALSVRGSKLELSPSGSLRFDGEF